VLHLTAASFGLGISSGRGEITTTGFTALGHARSPDAGPGQPLPLPSPPPM
jgi:hypothetical protein